LDRFCRTVFIPATIKWIRKERNGKVRALSSWELMREFISEKSGLKIKFGEIVD